MMRLRGLVVLKMISSISSFSKIGHGGGLRSLNLSQNGSVTRILEVGIDRVFEVIEKGFEAGIPIAFCGWFVSIGDFSQKGKNFIRGDGIHFPVNEFGLEMGKNELIIFHRVFFWN
jgi:hypothetical protein